VRQTILLLATLALAACGGDGAETSEPAGSPKAAVTDLANVLQLRSDFEGDAGKARVILLFSPT